MKDGEDSDTSLLQNLGNWELIVILFRFLYLEKLMHLQDITIDNS